MQAAALVCVWHRDRPAPAAAAPAARRPGLTAPHPPSDPAAAQTAYANGASTDYIGKDLGLETACTPTGVKYLHHEAKAFDIGIYFESNGHGTVLFKPAFLDRLAALDEQVGGVVVGCGRVLVHGGGAGGMGVEGRAGGGQRAAVTGTAARRGAARQRPAAAPPPSLPRSPTLHSPLPPRPQVATLHILAVSRLMNQAVGDAISGLLLVEAVLRCGTPLGTWEALYADLPSRQSKLKVKDRSAITTADAERTVVTPPGLQAAIAAAAARFPRGRAFARPSGTEDAVRVYAEADTQEGADALAAEVARAVYDLAGGVGPRP